MSGDQQTTTGPDAASPATPPSEEAAASPVAPPPPAPCSVFIACATGAGARVAELVSGIEQSGLDVLQDCDEPPGSGPDESADVVLVAWTPAACSNDHIVQQAMRAKEGRRLVQVLLVPCRPPAPFGKKLETFDLTRWHPSPDDVQMKTLAEMIRAQGEGRTPRLFVLRTWLLTWGGAGILAAALIATVSNIAGIQRTWDTFTGGGLGKEDIAGLSDKLTAQDKLVSAMVARFQGDSRAQGFEPDTGTVEAYKTSLVQMAMSPEARRNRIFMELATGDPAKALADLIDLANEQMADKETAAELDSRKQIGALSFQRDPRKALEAYERALALAPRDPVVLMQLGQLYIMAGRLEDAEVVLKGVLEVNETDDPMWTAAVTLNLGAILSYRGEFEAAARNDIRAFMIAAGAGDLMVQGKALHNLGAIAMYSGNVETAREFVQLGLDRFREAGLIGLQGDSLTVLGSLASRQGNLDEAETLLNEALKIHRDLKNIPGEANDLGNLSDLYLARGDFDGAEKSMKAGLAIFERLNAVREQAMSLNLLGAIARQAGRPKDAQGYVERALEISQNSGDQLELTKNYLNLGNIKQDLGELDDAVTYLDKSVALSRQIGARDVEASALVGLASIRLTEKNPAAAKAAAEGALAIAREIGQGQIVASSLATLGRVAAANGDKKDAEAKLREAMTIFNEMGATGESDKVVAMLRELGIEVAP